MCKKIHKNIITLCVFLALFVMFAGGCGDRNEETKVEKHDEPVVSEKSENKSTANTPEPVTPQEVPEVSVDSQKNILAEFLQADTKHMTGHYEAVYSSSLKEVFDFEVWQKSNKVRIDYIRGEGLYRTLISDGQTAVFYFYGKGTSTESISPPEYYSDLFTQDISKATVRTENVPEDSTAISFVIDEFYIKSNAQKGYFMNEIYYILKGEEIIAQVCLGNSSGGNKPSNNIPVTQTFGLIEINIEVSDEIFNNPF